MSDFFIGIFFLGSIAAMLAVLAAGAIIIRNRKMQGTEKESETED